MFTFWRHSPFKWLLSWQAKLIFNDCYIVKVTVHFSIPKTSKLSFLVHHFQSYFNFKVGSLLVIPCLLPRLIELHLTWWSGYCYLNKGECNLNQSKDDSFVEWVAKNNSWNNENSNKKIKPNLPLSGTCACETAVFDRTLLSELKQSG